MRDFTTQDEEIHDTYVESRRVIVLSRRQDWNYLAKRETEMRWIEAWNAGVQLMPLPTPVMPAILVALDNADDVLINDIVWQPHVQVVRCLIGIPPEVHRHSNRNIMLKQLSPRVRNFLSEVAFSSGVSAGFQVYRAPTRFSSVSTCLLISSAPPSA